MVHISRLKMILIWLAMVTMFVDAPSLHAAGPDVLLRLDAADVINRRLEATRDEIRTLLRDARIGYTGLGNSGRAVQVHITDAAQVDAAKIAVKAVTDPVPGSADPVQEMILDNTGAALLKFTVTDAGIKYWTSIARAQAIVVIKNRLRDLGVADPAVQPQGEDGVLLVRTAGVADLQRLRRILIRTGMLTFQWVDESMPVDDAVDGRTPAGSVVVYSQDDPPVPYLVESRTIVSSDDIVSAQAIQNSVTNEPVVAFTFDTKARARVAQATSQNVGKLFAMILDNQVLSVPIVREPILNGRGRISGNLTNESAEDLALLLRSGPMPAKLRIVEQRTIAPGSDQR
jgi:SecD/SecF fusion protein